ncbi:MAG: ABC transporter substrate-binding protein [Flavobacteriales bacterium]|nr:ABC transporter substrate-binding protein [Flavobacteriales bacterium]
MRSFGAWIGLALLVACTGDPGTHARSDWTELPNHHARCFRIFARGDERKVIVFGSGGADDTIAVHLTGTTKHRDGSDAIPVPPLDRIAVLSTTHLPFISALDRTDRVMAATDLERIRDVATKQRISQGEIREIATADGIDREQLLLAEVQVVFDYPFGQATHRATSPDQLFIPVTEYLEEHPLGRAEWIRFFGVLLDAEERADSMYAAIEGRYNSAAARAENRTTRPSVLFGSAWQGQWHVPAGNSYMAHLIEGAGGRYLFADRKGIGNIPLDMETMVSQGSQADVWGMIAEVDGVPSELDFTGGDDRLAGFKAVKEKHLFIGNSATADLFGQALLEPDVVLSELHEVITVNAVFDHPGGYRPRYFKHLGPGLITPRIEELSAPQ